MVLSGLPFQRVVLRTVFALLSLLPVACWAGEPAASAGTMPEDYLPGLREILQTALQRSPDAIAREFTRLAAEARLDLARAPRLPQLRGDFNYGGTQTAEAGRNNTQTRDSGFFYNVGFSQALFHWGALKNQQDAAKISLLVEEKSFALAYRELSVTLRKVYLALIVEKARLRQAREALRLLADDVAIVRAKKESGLVSSAVLSGEELRQRESQLEVDRAEAEFATNRARFGRLAGLPGGTLAEDEVPNDIPRPVYSEPRAAAMAAALLRDNAKSTLEFEIYDLRVREAILRQKIEAVRLLPKFGANAGYSLENTTKLDSGIAEQRAVARQTIGIGGSWNFFDGFATRGAKREALIARRALEQRKTADLEQLLQNAQALERSLKLDAEQLEIADVRRAQAIEGHRRVTEEAGFGLLPRGDIKRAQINILLVDAKTFETRAAFLGRWSEFVALAGDDPALNHLPARYARAKN